MKKIIIIDDDPAIQDSAGLIFKAADYQVAIHPNGNFLFTGGFEVPDVFIIDKRLPGIDGLEICKHLKEQAATKNVPVIMMSASPALNELSKQAGAEAFIEKPYTIQLLRELVIRHTS